MKERNIFIFPKGYFQNRDQRVIYFYGRHMLAASRKPFSEAAQAGTDFKDLVFGCDTGQVDDLIQQRNIRKKILPQ